MRRLAAAVASAAFLLALTTATALGRSGFSASPATSYLFFDDVELGAGGELSVRCDMTLGVSLATSIPKLAGSAAGSISLAISTGACTGGDAGVLYRGVRTAGLAGPSALDYRSFGGTLPTIASINFDERDALGIWVDMGLGELFVCSIQPTYELTLLDGPDASNARLALGGPGGAFCPLSPWAFSGTSPLYADLAHTTRTTVGLALL